tara:strand:- start:266 stop:475 length:210 start_codon:yes stop_codon:yes gene_type:complete
MSGKQEDGLYHLEVTLELEEDKNTLVDIIEMWIQGDLDGWYIEGKRITQPVSDERIGYKLIQKKENNNA